MTPERQLELERNLKLKLTEDELAAGWHFCPDWDGLLLHETHPEIQACSCVRHVVRPEEDAE